MKRSIIIGDVHGCYLELEDLLQRCSFKPEDNLIFVGDLVAKGPNSKKVIEQARKLGARSVIGNHDRRILDYWQASKQGLPLPQLKPSHQEVCAQLDEDDWQWLDTCPLWISFDDDRLGACLVVHAGLLAGVPLEAQNPLHLTTMRSLKADGNVSYRSDEGVPWARQWQGPPHVIFGHDAVRGLQQYPWATGLDTGCVYGKELTALILPERRLVSVPARQAWSPIE